MSMIKCPECGKEISDLASACPNCGFPMGFESARNSSNNNSNINLNSNPGNNRQQTFKTYNPEKDFEKKNMVWGILAGLMLLTVVLAPIGIIIMWTKKTPKTLPVRMLVTAFFGLIFVLWFTGAKSQNKETDNSNTNNNIASQESNDNSTAEVTKVVESESIIIPTKETYEDVFFYTLMDNADYYNGKNVRTIIQVSRCYQSDDKAYIESRYSEYDLVENSSDITIYPDNYQEFESDEYITVEGVFIKEKYDNTLINSHIVDCGTNSQTIFERDLSIFIAEHNQKLQEEKEAFIESCISVTYDDLRKYPESYEDVPVKLTIYAKDVEPDGWIFPGDIIATMDGEELAVYDDRVVREPRILEGETVTIYAVGYGLSTIKVKQKGLVFNKTVDEYNVPAVKIKYTENDKDFVEE